MKLGFIGTGKIASSVITGICNSKIKFKQIIISPRNKTIANSLKRKFNKITIAKNNQEIIDKSNWIFLSVTPKVGEKIIKELKFKTGQIICYAVVPFNFSCIDQLRQGGTCKCLGIRCNCVKRFWCCGCFAVHIERSVRLAPDQLAIVHDGDR